GPVGVRTTLPSGPYLHMNCLAGRASPLAVITTVSVHAYCRSAALFAAADSLIAASLRWIASRIIGPCCAFAPAAGRRTATAAASRGMRHQRFLNPKTPRFGGTPFV